MPAPTVVTESDLASYLHRQLQGLASVLGWSVGAGSYADQITATELALGVSNISSLNGLSSVRQIYAVGQRELWKSVVAALSEKFKFSTDFQTFEQQQMQAMARHALEDAEHDCRQLGIDWSVQMAKTFYPGDPYVYTPEEFKVP